MRPILIALDGGPQGAGAIRIALELAQRAAQPIEFITVIDPVAPIPLEDHTAPPEGYELLEHTRARDAARAVEERLREVDSIGGDLPLTVEIGVPAAVIARRAYAIRARAVFVGSAPRNATAYWARSETPLRIAQLSPCPVIAVQPNTLPPLHRGMVAVARLDTGFGLARRLFPVLSQDATIFVTHVVREAVELEALPSLRGWREAYERFVSEKLDHIAEAIRAAGRMKVEVVIARGEPGVELIGLADRLNVDVLAAGSHGQLGRMIVGPIATQVMRGARCSVLLNPSRATVMDVRKLWRSHPRVLLSASARPARNRALEPPSAKLDALAATSVR